MTHNKISKLIIGTAQFGMSYGIANPSGRVKKNQVYKILDFAYANGINTLDTAKAYGNSEDVTGSYIKQNKEKNWAAVTKVKSSFGALYNQVLNTALKLNINPYVVLAHSSKDYFNSSFRNELYNLKETLNVKKVGVSIYNVNEIKSVLSLDILPDVIQLPMSIIDTRLFNNKMLDDIKNKQIEIHVRSVFLQGLMFIAPDKFDNFFKDLIKPIKSLKKIANQEKLSLSELSLLWVCSLDQVDKVIVGIDNFEQLVEHVSTLEKDVNPKIYKDALNIRFDNNKILNPSLWPKKP